jgi:hypothetical protein
VTGATPGALEVFRVSSRLVGEAAA